MKKIAIIFLILLGMKIYSQSSQTENVDNSLDAKMVLIAMPYDDSIVLRWAPSQPSVWLIGNKSGYIVEKARINPDGKVGKYESIKQGTFKPCETSEFKDIIDYLYEQNDTLTANNLGMAYSFVTEDYLTDEKIDSKKAQSLEEIIEKKNQLDMKFGFTLILSEKSSLVAESIGLGYTDQNVKKGARYSYRVYLAGESPVYKIDTGYIEVEVRKYDKSKFETEIIPIENDGSILLRWKSNKELSFYFIERSEDNGKTFSRITKSPFINSNSNPDDSTSFESYLDTNVLNYNPYKYRIIGTTPFATEEYVGLVDAMGRDRTPPGKPILKLPEHFEKHKARIIWQMTEPVAKDLAGFKIGRDTSATGPYQLLTPVMLKPDIREFIDEGFILDGKNYYIVQAIDTAGNASTSMPVFLSIIDSTPPEKPVWNSGKMDSNGVVTLILKPNEEKDIMGYRILRSNGENHEFSSIIQSYGNDSIDYSLITTFIDTVTLNTTTSNVYYRATALDRNYNESSYSDVLVVKRIDTIPPVPPVITDVFVTQKTVELTFVPSSDEDVVFHTIFRRISGSENWDSIAVIGKRDSIFIDNTVIQNILYEYTLTATDNASLISPKSLSINARPYYTGVLQKIKDLKINYDSTLNQISLIWTYSEKNENCYFMVYRSFNSEGLMQYSRINKHSDFSYVDKNLSKGIGIYEYAIKVFDNNGGESPLSETVYFEIK